MHYLTHPVSSVGQELDFDIDDHSPCFPTSKLTVLAGIPVSIFHALAAASTSILESSLKPEGGAMTTRMKNVSCCVSYERFFEKKEI